MRRRDAAVRGFHHWRIAVADHGPSALEPLYRRAVELLGDRPEGWLELIAGDPAVDLERSRAQVEELWTPDRSGAAARLGESAVRSRSLHPDVRRMGCCGTLGTVVH
jgi:hypothetical protein